MATDKTAPDYLQWRQQQQDPASFSPTSSGSSGSSDSSAASSSPPLPAEFSLSPKSKRILSLKTYLAKVPEWSNPARMKSLYSVFDKLKESNIFGYEANIKWWRAVILGAARNGLLSMCPSSASLSSRYNSTATSNEEAEVLVCEPTGTATGILELDLEYVAARFEKNGMRPASLQTVMDEMNLLGEIVPHSQFLPWAGVTWSGWFLHKAVKAPLLWSLKQLSLSNSSPTPSSSSPKLASTGFGSPGGAGSGSNGVRGSASTGGLLSVGNGIGLGLSSSISPSATRETFVIIPFVQEAAARIIKLQQEASFHASDNVMTFEDFRQKFSRTALLPIRGKPSNDDGMSSGPLLVLTDRDLEIVLRYMHYEMKVLITGKLDTNSHSNEVQDDEMVIRFATKDALQSKSRQEITAADRGIIELRHTCKRLEKQVQEVEGRMSELKEKARICVRKNQRPQAAFALRTRKSLEDVLHKRLQSLDTLSSILFRIQSSETDAEILQSYRLGAKTLAAVMATKDVDGTETLSVEAVEKTMDRISDVFADQQEVDDAISIGTSMMITSTGGMDESELMAELDALVDSKPQQISPSISPPLANKITAPEKRASPVRLVPAHRKQTPPLTASGTTSATATGKPTTIKRTTPPLASEPRLSSSASSHSSITLGKRVAEIPEAGVVKQRRVSESSVCSSPHGASVMTENEHGSPSTTTISTTPETSKMDVDHATTDTTTPIPSAANTNANTDGLLSQEEREFEELVKELEEIHAPTNMDHVMDDVQPVKEVKVGKEKPMLENA
ncbi:hypothetical protein BGX28_006600 [Mortierella sp. GBA30]|nr:hypothetical protein BGX28_006600 [Mortierella sp. GBA30]